MTKLVYFDAGHGKYTSGKRSPSGKFEEREWFFNDEVARAFEAEMKTYKGVKLVRTDDRTGETDVPLGTRTSKANSAKADLYISFHHNAFQSKWGNHGGTETFYYAGSSQGKKLAQMVQNAQLKAYGLADRGIKTNNLHITRETRMVAVLTEGGFMDSNIDIKKLRDKKVLQRAGREIAHAVASYLGLSKGSNTSKPIAPPSKPNTSKPSTPSKPSTSKPTEKLGLVDWMKSKKMDSSFANRKKLAGQYGIKNYTGTASQNNTLLAKLQSGSKPNTSKPTKPSTSKPQASTGALKVGGKVKIKTSAKTYSRANATIPATHKNKTYTIQQVGKNDVLIKELYSWVRKSDLVGQTGASTSSSTNKTNTKNFKVGQTVTLKKSATKFATGQSILNSAKGKKYKIIQVKSDRVLLDGIMSWAKKTDVQ